MTKRKLSTPPDSSGVRQLTIRLTSDEAAQLEALAKTEFRSISEQARAFIVRGLRSSRPLEEDLPWIVGAPRANAAV